MLEMFQEWVDEWSCEMAMHKMMKEAISRSSGNVVNAVKMSYQMLQWSSVHEMITYVISRSFGMLFKPQANILAVMGLQNRVS